MAMSEDALYVEAAMSLFQSRTVILTNPALTSRELASLGFR